MIWLNLIEGNAWNLQEKMHETKALTVIYFVLSLGEVSLLSPISMFLGLGAANWLQIGALPSALFVRRALMLFLANVSGVIGTLEQSLTSSMHKAPPMSIVLAYIGATRITTSHGAFGGSTTKLLQLFSSAKLLVSMMRKKRPKRLKASGVPTLVTRRGKKFTGKRGAMKNSQH